MIEDNTHNNKVTTRIIQIGIIITLIFLSLIILSVTLSTFRDFFITDFVPRGGTNTDVMRIFQTRIRTFPANIIVFFESFIALIITVLLFKKRKKIIKFLTKYDFLNSKEFSITLLIIFFLIALIYYFLESGQVLSDLRIIRNSAINFVNGEDIDIIYFSRYPLNLGYLWYNILLVRLFGASNLNISLFLFNILFLILTLGHYYKSLRLSNPENNVKIFNITFIALVLFLPLANYMSFFYTFLFNALIYLLFFSFMIRYKNKTLSLANILTLSLIIGFGSVMRGNVYLLGIAFAIYIFVVSKRLQKLFAPVIIVLMVTVNNLSVATSEHIFSLDTATHQFGASHWINMGQGGETGRHSTEDVQATIRAIEEGRGDEIGRENLISAINRVRARNLRENITFYSNKLSITWGQGDFGMHFNSRFSSNSGDVDPENPRSMKEWALTNTSFFVRLALNVYIKIAYFMFAIILYKSIKNKKYWYSYYLIFILTFTGTVVFFLIFETFSRYAFPIIPSFILVLVYLVMDNYLGGKKISEKP